MIGVGSSLSGLIVAAVTALLGGGLLTGIYALLKLRPEAGQIVVTAAQGVVVMQVGVIDRLTKENERLNEASEACREKLDAMEEKIAFLELRERERSHNEANGI